MYRVDLKVSKLEKDLPSFFFLIFFLGFCDIDIAVTYFAQNFYHNATLAVMLFDLGSEYLYNYNMQVLMPFSLDL